jgi:hypothetical protein
VATAPFLICAALLILGGVLLHHLRSESTVGKAEYVAMGSCFAVGPAQERVRVPDSFIPCERSDANYAHILARRYGFALKDVTCSAATSEDVLKGGQFIFYRRR